MNKLLFYNKEICKMKKIEIRMSKAQKQGSRNKKSKNLKKIFRTENEPRRNTSTINMTYYSLR